MATELTDEMLIELHRRYGPGEWGSVDSATFRAPVGAFVVAYLDEQPAGCGGLVRVDSGLAQVKRMFVRAIYLRRAGARYPVPRPMPTIR